MPTAYRLLLVMLLILAARADASELPVLFVHGWCGSSGSWTQIIDDLQPSARFGNGVTHLYLDRDTVKQRWAGDGSPARELFTIDFHVDFAPADYEFDPYTVASVPIERKAYELYRVLQEVKRISGKPTAIVVAHSMGGLVSRAYIEGLASKTGDTANIAAFQNDIARLITIDTPHRGSALAHLYGVPGLAENCQVGLTLNKEQLRPNSPFLARLNDLDIPGNVDIVSIISYQPTIPEAALGDGVVSYDSQNLTSDALPRYNQRPNIHREQFPNFAALGSMHTKVLRDSGMFAIVRRRIDEIDQKDFGFLLGRLFLDSNVNGRWDPGETFVTAPHACTTGAAVMADIEASWTGPVNSDGPPRFCNPEPFYHSGPIPTGTYTVTANVPAGWAVTPYPSSTVQVRPEGTHVWLALRPPTAPSTMGFVIGRMWLDSNGNDSWDPGEAFVTAPNSCPTGTALTGFSARWTGTVTGTGLPQFCNPDPYYRSNPIPVGPYDMSVATPPGWSVKALPASTVQVRPEGTHVWFALRPPSASASGFLLGRMWIDTNGNNVFDSGEAVVAAPNSCSRGTVMAGFGVSWSGPTQGSGLPEYCNPDPFYHSGLIATGTYAVSATVPPGWSATILPASTMQVRPEGTHVWVALRPPSSSSNGFLLGRMFVDTNGNNALDAGEAVIAAPNSCSRGTAMTGFGVSWSGHAAGTGFPQYCNPDPFYHSGLIPTGTYEIRATVPAGWSATILPASTMQVRPEGTHVWVAVRPSNELVPRSCSSESTLRSIEGVTVAPVEFVNASGGIRKLYWLDYTGQRSLYNVLSPGESVTQNTYLTHPWVVTNAADVCLGIYLPVPGSSTARLQ